MEEPGYNKASAVFQNNGCIIECVPVDKDGLCTEKLLGGTDIGVPLHTSFQQAVF